MDAVFVGASRPWDRTSSAGTIYTRISPWLDSAVAHDFRRVGRVRGGALGSRIVLVSWDLNKSELNERYADQALRPSVSAPAGRLVCGIVVFFGASAARSV